MVELSNALIILFVKKLGLDVFSF